LGDEENEIFIVALCVRLSVTSLDLPNTHFRAKRETYK
jgi:hypothetical protein